MLNSTRARLILVGFALCAALFLLGCPDNPPTSPPPSVPSGDTTLPVLVLEGADVLTVELGVDFTDPGATATDNDPAYGDRTATATSPIGSGIIINGTTIRATIAGTYTITYTAPPDAANNAPEPVTRTVIVQDSTSPVIALMGDTLLLFEVGDTFADEAGAIATDNDPVYGEHTATGLITDSDGTMIPANMFATSAAGTYTITYNAPPDAANNAPAPVTRAVRIVSAVDSDSDDLIDINNIGDFIILRHNLAGIRARCGVGGTTDCTGYELMGDLDFTDGTSYASGTVDTELRPNAVDPDSATNAGWIPIGSCNEDTADLGIVICGDADDEIFAATFAGNGFVISNLYSRGTGGVGVFGTNSGTIAGIGIVDARLYGGVGADSVGGVVGHNTGTVTASYATGIFDGGDGRGDKVGGLIGDNDGTVTASYAAGSVSGGDGADNAGGLIGDNEGIVTANYATGDVNGGDGGNDNVGGLVGANDGTITASYAIGDVNGGAGADRVGGLIGSNSKIVTASYATGNVDGGAMEGDHVGGLIGRNIGPPTSATVTASYGFGMQTGGERTTGPLTRSTDASNAAAVANACALTQANSSTMTTTPDNRWDAAQWDFGTTAQRPVVLYEGVVVRGQTDRNCI